MELWIEDRVWLGLIHGTQIAAKVLTQPVRVREVPRFQMLR